MKKSLSTLFRNFLDWPQFAWLSYFITTPESITDESLINRVLDVPFVLTNLRSRVLGVIACLTCLCALRAWRGYVS